MIYRLHLLKISEVGWDEICFKIKGGLFLGDPVGDEIGESDGDDEIAVEWVVSDLI